MKLRNKKNGEKVIVDFTAEVVSPLEIIGDLCPRRFLNFSSIKELNEEWEDYEPKEPLIKDEKIRKAVRAWAGANDIERVWHEYSSCWLRGNGLKIELENEVVDLEQKNYTIDELCGVEDD